MSGRNLTKIRYDLLPYTTVYITHPSGPIFHARYIHSWNTGSSKKVGVRKILSRAFWRRIVRYWQPLGCRPVEVGKPPLGGVTCIVAYGTPVPAEAIDSPRRCEVPFILCFEALTRQEFNVQYSSSRGYTAFKRGLDKRIRDLRTVKSVCPTYTH